MMAFKRNLNEFEAAVEHVLVSGSGFTYVEYFVNITEC